MQFLRVISRAFLVAFLAIGFFAFAVETLDRAFVRPYGSYSRCERKYQKAREQIEILFMGQSDIGDGIKSDELPEQAFNFAWGGETLVGTYYKLKAHVDEMPRLKLIVLAVPLCSFTDSRTHLTRMEHYIFHIGYPEVRELCEVQGPIVWRQKLLSLVSFFEYRTLKALPYRLNRVAKQFRDRKNDAKPKRKKPIRDTPDWPEEADTREAILSHFEHHNPYDPSLLLYFSRVLNLARKKDLPVVALTLPVSGPYLEMSKPYITMEQLQEKVLHQPEIRPLIRAHLNYLDLYADRIEYFKNPDHLNDRGWAEFTHRVLADLNPILESIPPADRASGGWPGRNKVEPS